MDAVVLNSVNKIPLSPIKSIQRGTIAINNSDTSAAATISTVNTSKTMINLLGFSGTDTSFSVNRSPRITLTNGTTVTATRASTSGNITISFEVIEYV